MQKRQTLNDQLIKFIFISKSYLKYQSIKVVSAEYLLELLTAVYLCCCTAPPQYNFLQLLLIYIYQEPTETSKQPIRARYLGHVTGYQPIRDQHFLIRSVYSRTPIYRDPRGKPFCPVNRGARYIGLLTAVYLCCCTAPPQYNFLQLLLIYIYQEPTETSKQPIRARYLGHVTGYQPIRDQHFLIRSVYSRTPIYRDPRGKPFCPVNRGARYIGVYQPPSNRVSNRCILSRVLSLISRFETNRYMIPIRPSELQKQVYQQAKLRKFSKKNRGKEILPVNRGSGKSGPGKSGSDCIYDSSLGQHVRNFIGKEVPNFAIYHLTMYGIVISSVGNEITPHRETRVVGYMQRNRDDFNLHNQEVQTISPFKNSLFRSRDWLLSNQGPVIPDSVGSCSIRIRLTRFFEY
eukprot:sb/3465293/